MKHQGTKIIETERLILRRFTMDDAEMMFRNWASDPEVSKYLPWSPHADVEVTKMVLEDWTGHYGEENYYQWAIVPRDLGEPIGSITGVHVNEKANWVEIGYCMGKPWWRKGIMSEALNGLMAFFFEEVGVGRIQARHDPRNVGSGAVMRKCGMICEGTLRRADRNNQGICDVTVYSILREEYYADK